MFNYIVLILLTAFLAMAILTVFIELIGKRWTAAGLFFRSIRIRMREISPLSVCTSSIVLLIFGLVVGDDCFIGIWTAIALMFASLAVLNFEDLFDLRKRRKKAKKRSLAPILPENGGTSARELPELHTLPELTELKPISNDEEPEQKG